MNRMKTTLLLGLLTGLFLFIGGAVGGQRGMLMALVMAAVMNFVSYFFSDKLALAAYGAKLVGDPRPLASALRKLGSPAAQALPLAGASPTNAHLCIVSPLSGGGLMSLFSTHPPLEERIRRLLEMRP